MSDHVDDFLEALEDAMEARARYRRAASEDTPHGVDPRFAERGEELERHALEVAKDDFRNALARLLRDFDIL